MEATELLLVADTTDLSSGEGGHAIARLPRTLTVEGAPAEFTRFAARFRPRRSGRIAFVAFALNAGDNPKGSGLLRVSKAAPDSLHPFRFYTPAAPVDSADIALQLLSPAQFNFIVVEEADGWDVQANEDFFIIFHLADASPDAEVQFLIDRGDEQPPDSARSVLFAHWMEFDDWGWRFDLNKDLVVAVFVLNLLEPALAMPEDGAADQALTPLLQWRSVENATAYRVEVSTNIGFPPLVGVTQSSLVPGDTTFAASGLVSGTKYFWRVRAEVEDGAGNWSEVRTFTTATATTLDEAPDAAAWRFYPPFPNPFIAQTDFHFDLTRATRVRLHIFDLLGREVARLHDAFLGPGSHRLTWLPDGRPAGLYLVRLEAGTQVLTRRITLVR